MRKRGVAGRVQEKGMKKQNEGQKERHNKEGTQCGAVEK
jgi:hypothetical protein